MLFSFIIPVYNCKDYLEDCVNSVCAITMEDYEILLIDDGSTDGSAELCDSIQSRCSKVRVIHQANSGVSAARNAGIYHAQGDYLLFVDSDDTVQSQKLSELLNLFPKTGSDLAVFGISFDYYRNGKCYRSDKMGYAYTGVLTRKQWSDIFLDLFDANALSSSCTKVFKRETLTNGNISFNTERFLYEDFEFVLKYLTCCETIYFDANAIYQYRQSEDEGNAGRRLKRVTDLSEFVDGIGEVLLSLEKSNSYICREHSETILSRLYQTLAREKIAVSNLAQAKDICRSYAAWSAQHEKRIIDANSKMHDRLLKGKAITLKLSSKKVALRHKIAVWVKAVVLPRIRRSR